MSKTEIIATVVSCIVVPLIGWLVATLTEYLKEKTTNAKLDKYFDLACDAVITSVKDTMQTFVSTLKANGEWDGTTAAQALEIAKAKAVELMGAAAYKALSEIVLDVESWLISKVEAATLTVKMEARNNGNIS